MKLVTLNVASNFGAKMRRKVKIKKGQLNYFRKLARNTDLEIQAYLVGRVTSPELFIVDYIAYAKRYHTQTEGHVSWYAEDFETLKQKVASQNQIILGDIHSHPNYWPVMSETDHKTHIMEGSRISGICATMNKKTKVYFWVADSALPCTIEYV